MNRDWIDVKDRLPDSAGWYLVFAPGYSGGSSSSLNHHDGVMFSQLKISAKGKKTWSIESGYYSRPGCVLYWMPLPMPTEFGHLEVAPGTYRPMKIWVDGRTNERTVFQ